MKKTYILVLGAIATLTSCGMIARSSSSDDGHRFNDGIYDCTPSFRTKEEKAAAKSENDALVSKTKESPVYLFGDRKDTIMIPDNFSAKIQYDQKIGGTVVTVGENPYDWRWFPDNMYGYWPYSFGSTWYWNRYYSPYWSPYWSPYRYSWGCYGFYDPWYYGGYYDPWYYGGYWGGYWGGFYDPWYHHHHHGWYDPHHHGPSHIGGPAEGKDIYHGLRAHTEKSFTSSGRTATYSGSTVRTTGGTVRGGMKVGSTTSRSSRSSSISRPSTGTRTSSGTAPASRPASTQYRRPASSQSSYDRQSSGNDSSPSYSRGSSYERSSSYSRGSNYGSSSSGSYNRGGSSYGGSSGSYSRGSSSGSSGYSRSSSGGYRR